MNLDEIGFILGSACILKDGREMPLGYDGAFPMLDGSVMYRCGRDNNTLFYYVEPKKPDAAPSPIATLLQ